MATEIIHCWVIEMQDGERIEIFSKTDLASLGSLESIARYAKSMTKVPWRVAVATNGESHYDGVKGPAKNFVNSGAR